jgi:hypothetical protein
LIVISENRKRCQIGLNLAFYFLGNFIILLPRCIIIFVQLKIKAMIIVHDTFVCKPGNASKMAKLFKEVMTGNDELVNIMTDMTGAYNRVIMVSKYDSLTAYEESFRKYMEDSEEMKVMKEKMKGYQDMYITGSREVFQVW